MGEHYHEDERRNRRNRPLKRNAAKRAAWRTAWTTRESEADGIRHAIRSALRAVKAGRPVAMFRDTPDYFGTYSRDSVNGDREADAYDNASIAIATLLRQPWIDVEQPCFD